MKVRAAVVRDYGQEIEVLDLDLRAPGPGEVRVQMVASGVCHSDLHAMAADLPLPVPIVLGHEGAGIVDAVGAGVHHLNVGDPVVLSWIPPCGQCLHCIGQEPHLCTAAADATRDGVLLTGPAPFSYQGEIVHPFSMTGTLSEATVVPAQGAILLPPDVPLEHAALFGCALLTGMGAVFRVAKLAPGAHIAVFGAGGVGLSIISAARIAGASRIIAVDPIEARRSLATLMGATDLIDPHDGSGLDGVLQATHGLGVDVAFDAVGAPEVLQEAFNASRRGGLTVAVGVAPPHREVSLNAFAFPSQGKTLTGCWYGNADVRRDIAQLVRLYRAGQLSLASMLSEPYPLADVRAAFDDLIHGRSGRARVCFP